MVTRSGVTFTVVPAVIAAMLAACVQAPDDGHAPAAADQTPAAQPTPTPKMAVVDEPVTEIDLGVPLYPDARLLEHQSSMKAGADSQTVIAEFETVDPPYMVVSFYRNHLASRAQGAELLEQPNRSGGTTLMLDDPDADLAVQLEVRPWDQGSRVKLISVVFPIG